MTPETSDASEQPVPWCDVLRAELQRLDPTFETLPALPGDDLATNVDTLNQVAFSRGHAALCLSGGGIRSASFAIGVLQTFARHGVLPQFDYLSTVSGGGFAGAWLSAWIARGSRHPLGVDADADRDAVAAREALQQFLGGGGHAGQVEPWPVTRVRQFTRYLNPQAGLFSADFWGLVVTMLRNLLLNWLVIIPLLAAALLVPRMHYSLIHLSERALRPEVSFSLLNVETYPLLLGWLGQLAWLAFAVADLPSYGNRGYSQRQFIVRALIPLSLGTLSLTYFWSVNQMVIPLAAVVVTSAVLNAGVWMVIGFLTGNRPFRPRTWFAGAIFGAVTGAGMGYLMDFVWQSGVELHTMYITFAFPAVLTCLLLGIVAFIGIASNELTPADIEWWSRCGGWMLIVIVGWLAVCGIVFGGPAAVREADTLIPGARRLLAFVTPGIGVVGAWLARPNIKGERPWLRRAALSIAAPAFSLLLLLGLAYVDDAAVRRLAHWPMFLKVTSYPLPLCGRTEEEHTHNLCRPEGAGAPETLAFGGVLLLVGFGTSRFVAANKFSLHGMYRQRLTRTFLGASRTTRHPNPFTGFDPADDLEMTELARQRPFHVVNVTLNKRGDSQVGHQQRQAESFTFTPLHAGNVANGYRPAGAFGKDQSQQQAITLGAAITVSGAAASPAMGEFSTASLAFLLTLLNARLGAWFGNPGEAGRDTWRRSDPKAGVGPIIREMLGLTTRANPYVYLSDGGHFDNLGIWEMVLRRCKYIVVIDAGADPEFALTDLATAVRQVRIDHGARIDLDPLPERAPGAGHPHVLTGTIRYDDGNAGAVGRLVYIKPTISGDEPVDVLNYKKVFAAFPHESTADQWFSEAQFESYRMLGVHSAETALRDKAEGALGSVLEEMRADAVRHGRPTTPLQPGAFAGQSQVQKL